MYKIIFLTIVMTLHFTLAKCQDKYNNYYLMPSIAVLSGSNSTTTAIQAEVGKCFKRFQLGVQSSLDDYLFRSVPLTLQGKVFIHPQKNKLYLYAGAGYNVAWVTNQQKKIIGGGWWGNPNYEYADYKNGFAYNFGIGTIIWHKQSKGLNFFGGYSAKTVQEIYQELVFNGTNTVEIPRRSTYHLGRIQIGIGYSF